jgi:DNA-directed RNA polymerase alpha subunit
MPVPEIFIEVETRLSYRRMQNHLQRLKRQEISFEFQRATSGSFAIIFHNVKSVAELNQICATLSEIIQKPTEVKFLGVSLTFTPASAILRRSDPRLSRPISSLAVPDTLATYLAMVHNQHYVGDLASKPYDAIKAMRGVGVAKADRIEQALRAIGLQTGMNIPDWPPPKQAR